LAAGISPSYSNGRITVRLHLPAPNPERICHPPGVGDADVDAVHLEAFPFPLKTLAHRVGVGKDRRERDCRHVLDVESMNMTVADMPGRKRGSVSSTTTSTGKNARPVPDGFVGRRWRCAYFAVQHHVPQRIDEDARRVADLQPGDVDFVDVGADHQCGESATSPSKVPPFCDAALVTSCPSVRFPQQQACRRAARQ